MHVAICFWGLSRSLKYTIAHLKERVFAPLQQAGIAYTVFFHTYAIHGKYMNPRSKEFDIEYDNTQHTLLSTDVFAIDDDQTIRKELNLEQYTTHPDPWNTDYVTLKNSVMGMFSKRQVWELVEQSELSFTHYLYIRPDVNILTPFQVKWLEQIQTNEIYIPNFHQYHFHFNDRMMLCSNRFYARVYGTSFDGMLDYSKEHPLHSETYLRWYLLQHDPFLKISSIPFYFNRVRANGAECEDGSVFLKLHLDCHRYLKRNNQ